MTPVNMGFPSNKDKEIDFTPGFTAAEKKYLSRPSFQESNSLFFDALMGIILAATIVAVLLALFITWRAEKAEAAYTPTTNQEFCIEIEKGNWWVAEEDKEEVSAYCKSV